VILPPLLTGLLVALCLYLHKGLRAAHAWWLFELPGKRTKVTPPPAQSWADAPTRILPVVR
jgi:hypothetical protein